MRVAVVGSRRRLDREAVVAAVRALQPGAVIVSGGCEGPDQWAAAAARSQGLPVVEHLPDTAGCRQRFEFTRAYYGRNQKVVDDCDQVIAFVAADRKGGTEDTIRRARKAGKPVDVR
jgi:hypothetical protein